MNLFRSGLKNIVGGADDAAAGGDGAETVERLVERIETSTLLEDRRDALRAIKSLSKPYRLHVGTLAMNTLLQVLQSDYYDTDSFAYAIEALQNVIVGANSDQDGTAQNDPEDLGARFTEIFTKAPENISLCLTMIENYEFSVRLPMVRLLTGLLRHQPKKVQEILLVNPASIPKITDLLQDNREVIRNDTVLLLSELVRGSTNIQKIVAFENAFERLLTIIFEEGDGIVAEDCLYLILQLLKNNSSNHQLFRENSLIQHLVPLLNLLNGHSNEEDGEGHDHDHDHGHDNHHHADVVWTAQRVANMHLLLQVIRVLVSPLNLASNTAICQKIMCHCGLLKQLCEMMMAGGIPADVLTETINTVGEVIRGSPPNQDYFSTVLAPSDPPRTAVIILLMSMINEKQPFLLRCAAMYCVQCLLYKNDSAKSAIVQTLLPSSTETKEVTAGQLICSGLVHSDPLVVWFSSCTLLHCMLNAAVQCERLLRVQLASGVGNTPLSLMEQVTSILTQSHECQTRVAVLMLLAAWLSHCPAAVTQFLQNPANVPFLTSDASSTEGDEFESVAHGVSAFVFGICLYFNDDSVDKFSRSALMQIVHNRIGVTTFIERLERVSKSEFYAQAAQRPQPRATSGAQLVFDHEFTKLFHNLEPEILRLLLNESPGAGVALGDTLSQAVVNGLVSREDEAVVERYKQLIKRQDEELAQLRAKISRLEATPPVAADAVAEIQKQLDEKCRIIDDQKKYMEDLQNYYQSLPSVTSGSATEVERLKVELESTKTLLKQREAENVYYRQQCDAWQSHALSQSAALDPSGMLQTLHAQVRELESQLAYGWQAYEGVSQQLTAAMGHNTELKGQVDELVATVGRLNETAAAVAKASAIVPTEQSRHAQDAETSTDPQEEHTNLASVADEARKRADTATSDLKNLRKEQEDLLMLLADQDQKLREYRTRLKTMGLEVSSDEDDVNEEADLR